MPHDERDADDGAIHRFWRFIIRHRLAGRIYNLGNADGLREAVDAFEREEEA